MVHINLLLDKMIGLRQILIFRFEDDKIVECRDTTQIVTGELPDKDLAS